MHSEICDFVYIPMGTVECVNINHSWCHIFGTSSVCSFRCAQSSLALRGCRNQLRHQLWGTSALRRFIQDAHLCTVSPGVHILPLSLGLQSWHEWCVRYACFLFCLQPCFLDGSWAYAVDSEFCLVLSLAPSPLLLTGPWASLITLCLGLSVYLVTRTSLCLPRPDMVWLHL